MLQPAKSNVTVAVQVFSADNKILFAPSYSGIYSEKVGLHGQTGHERMSVGYSGPPPIKLSTKLCKTSQFQAVIRSGAGQV